jgi:dephospho-CoA kinase
VILRVGLTGGIASGKSTVARLLGELGCATVDADAIVADLYRPGRPGHDALVGSYGRDILLPDGEIDRVKLAGIAFSSASEAQQLNSLIHPLVISEEQRRMSEEDTRAGAAGAIVVVEATLLLESGGRQGCEKIVVIDLDPELQIERAVGRGMTRREAERRIEHQMPRHERLRYADYVIDNNGDREHLVAETRRLFDALRRDLAQKLPK